MPAFGLSRVSMAASDLPPPPTSSIHQLTPSFYFGASPYPSVDADQDTMTPCQFDKDKKTPYPFAPSFWWDSSLGNPSYHAGSDNPRAWRNHPFSCHAQQNLSESYPFQGYGASHGQGLGSYYGKQPYPADSGDSGAWHNHPFSGHAQQSMSESDGYQGYGASHGQSQGPYYGSAYMPCQARPCYYEPWSGSRAFSDIAPWSSLDSRPSGAPSDVQWFALSERKDPFTVNRLHSMFPLNNSQSVSQSSHLRNAEGYQQRAEEGESIEKLATSSKIPLENFDVKIASSDKQDDVGLKSQEVVAGCSDITSNHQELINKLAASSQAPVENCDAKTPPSDKQDDVGLKSQDVPARCSGFAINHQTNQTSDGPLTNIVDPNVDSFSSGAKADDKLANGESFTYLNHSTSTKLTDSLSVENLKSLKDEPILLHMRFNDTEREMGRMECDLSHTSTMCSMEDVPPLTKGAQQSANTHPLLVSSIYNLSSFLVARLTIQGENTQCRELDAIEHSICMLSQCLMKQWTEVSAKKHLQRQNTADKVVDTSDLSAVTETVKHCLKGGGVDDYNALSSLETGLSSSKLKKLLEGATINENHCFRSTVENNVDSNSETVPGKVEESLDLKKELLQIQQERAEERATLLKALEKLTLEVSHMQINLEGLKLLIEKSHGQVETLGKSSYDKNCEFGEVVTENKPSSRSHAWDRCTQSIDAFEGSCLQRLFKETELENKASSQVHNDWLLKVSGKVSDTQEKPASGNKCDLQVHEYLVDSQKESTLPGISSRTSKSYHSQFQSRNDSCHNLSSLFGEDSDWEHVPV